VNIVLRVFLESLHLLQRATFHLKVKASHLLSALNGREIRYLGALQVMAYEIRLERL
jgi:hypothetical protein